MILLLSPLVVCIVGLLMYALASNPKLVRIGEIMFAVGLFWLVAELGPALGLGAGPTLHR